MSDKLLEQVLLAHVKDSTIVNKILWELNESNNIKKDIESIEKAEQKLRENFNSEITTLRKRKDEIRAKCEHPVIKSMPDPSGGNDRHQWCEVCGKEW